MDIHTKCRKITSKIPHKNKSKVRNPTFPLSLSHLSHCLTLTSCQLLTVSYQISLSISLSIFLMISYIFQCFVRSIFKQNSDTFFVPPISSTMQRCLSKWFQKTIIFTTKSFHTSCEVRHLSHPFGWVIHTAFSFPPLFLHITPINPSFLLISTTTPSTLPSPQDKWTQSTPPERNGNETNKEKERLRDWKREAKRQGERERWREGGSKKRWCIHNSVEWVTDMII